MPYPGIRNDSEKREVEKVVSLLEHKIKRGLATEEERQQYREGVNDLVIFDWGTESYQNHVPNSLEAARRRKQEQKRARRSLVAPAPTKKLPEPDIGGSPRPELTRRPGRFAV